MSRAIARPVAIRPRPEKRRSAASLPKNELSSISASLPTRLNAGSTWSIRIPNAKRRPSRASLGNGPVTRSALPEDALRLHLADPTAIHRPHLHPPPLPFHRAPPLPPPPHPPPHRPTHTL